jgi:hypothetical protein
MILVRTDHPYLKVKRHHDAEYALRYDRVYTPFVHNILLNCVPEVRNLEDFKENLIITAQ